MSQCAENVEEEDGCVRGICVEEFSRPEKTLFIGANWNQGIPSPRQIFSSFVDKGKGKRVGELSAGYAKGEMSHVDRR